MNLPDEGARLKERLIAEWNASTDPGALPWDEVRHLLETKYRLDDWTRRRP